MSKGANISTDELIGQLISILEKDNECCNKFTNKKNPIGSNGRVSQIIRLSTRNKFDCIITILKQQQETIKEQKRLIESLWSWAEEQEEKQEEDEFPKYTGAYIDFCNFKLHDKYKDEKEGYVYFNGPSGKGYYAIRYKD